MVTPVVKNLQCRRCRFDPWVRKISRSRKWQPTPVFLPGKFHGQKGLVSYSARGHKVRYDWMTEHAPNSMVTDGNYIFGGEHAIMYTKVEVYCCTHETYYVISQCYFNEKELKRKFFFFPKRNKDKSQHPKHWNTGTNGAHSQKDPSDEADESRHCLFPQHCGMDIDSGNCWGKEPFWLHDGSLSLTLTFVFYCLHVWWMDNYSLLLWSSRNARTRNGTGNSK